MNAARGGTGDPAPSQPDSAQSDPATPQPDSARADTNLELAQREGPAAALERALILATCTLVTVLYVMTVTIANVSLPAIQGTRSATPDQIAWVVTSNLVATAVATPLAGWLVVRMGRRWLMNACVLAFGLASLGCGLSGSLEELVLWRTVQGAVGAPLVPASQAIVLDAYRRERHGAVLAIYGMGSVLGPIIGPTLGGWLAETYNWRWLFYMIVPFAIVSLLGTLAVIRDREIAQRKALDWTGFLSLSVALAAAQLMLDRGELADWFDAPEIIGWAAVALVALYAFVVHSLSTPQPFLDLRLFADRNFVVGLVLVFVFGMLNFTPMTLLPPLMQNVGSYPDSVVGLVIGSRGVGTLAAFSFMIVGSRIEPRLMIVTGFLLQAWAGWELAHLDTQPTVAAVFGPMVMQGFGVGLLWVPITMVTFNTLDSRLVPDGSAVYHMVRNFGSAVHISLTVTVSLRMARTAYGELAERVTPFNASVLPPAWSTDHPAGLASLARELHRQSMMIGYLDAFVFFVATSLVVLPLVAAIRLRKA